ncbi:MAG TPA: acyltransferase [Kofleriaceae bacterium]|nr:acyltransferase [Kofleriaceae bacterium]
MTAPGSVHIRGLDGIRGLAISMVLLYHGWTYRGPGDIGETVGGTINAVRVIGWAGVDVFFVLSGFLITGILVETKGQPRYWRNFLIRRGLRIFPLYYAVLVLLLGAGLVLARAGVVSGAAGELARGAGNIWVNFLYVTNFAVATWGEDRVPLDTAWSLAIEEQFYLVYPAIVLLCTRRGLVLALVAMTAAAPVLRVLVFEYGPQPVLGPYVLPFCRMDALAIGGLVRLAYGGGRPEPALLAVLRRLALPLCAAAIAVLLAWSRKDVRFVAVGYTLTAVAAAALLVRLLASPASPASPASSASPASAPLRRVFESRALVHIGKVSYAVYLFHLIARAVVAQGLARVFPREQIGGTAYCAAQLFGMSLLAIGAATASYHLFERPILRLKDRWAPAGRERF